MGNLEPWPPETHYRCVQIEGCNYDVEYPPTTFDGQWTGTKQYGIDPVPIITTRPCASESIIDSAASPDL